MDDSQITAPDTLQDTKESLIRKPLSVKILQVIFFSMGTLSLINLLIYAIVGKELSILIFGLDLYFSESVSINFTALDFYLLPLIFGMGTIISGLCLFHFSTYSLTIARRYIIALFFIIVIYFVLTAPLLPSVLFPHLMMAHFGVPWHYVVLIFVLALGDKVILVSTVIFALIKTKSLLKTNLPDRKTIFTPIEKLGKFSYVPLIVMLILFGVWCVDFLLTMNALFSPSPYQRIKPEEY
jgi:hypothetical protein